jgi:hypothetical protein
LGADHQELRFMWERAKVDWGRQRPGGTARFEGVKVGNKKRRVDLLNQMGIYVLYDKFEQPIQVRVRGPAGAVAQTHGDGLGKAAGRYSRKGHTQCLLDLDEVGLLSPENHSDSPLHGLGSPLKPNPGEADSIF